MRAIARVSVIFALSSLSALGGAGCRWPFPWLPGHGHGHAGHGGDGHQAGQGGDGDGDVDGGVNAACQEPIVPTSMNETCYELAVHNESSPADASPFLVPLAESYSELVYDVPWPAGSVATRIGVQLGAHDVAVHAWLFDAEPGWPHGQVNHNVTGTLLGTDAALIAPWSAGECSYEPPSTIGLRLPDPGSERRLVAQWHYDNQTGSPRADASKIIVCVEPAGARTVAAYTVLGTEDLNRPIGIPPGATTQYGEGCLNETDAPISLVAIAPHMHRIGESARVVIEQAAGGETVVHDEPFAFGAYRHHPVDAVLNPGDRLYTECAYNNTTMGSVGFGQPTTSEMCYAFALSYPVGALDKPGQVSLIGFTNSCWGDDG